MKSLKSALYRLISEKKISAGDAMVLLKEIQSHETLADDDIAIIGMSSRIPGAHGYEAFWDNISSGSVHIGEIPSYRRADLETVIDRSNGGQAILRKGGYIDGIDQFDASFFRISPKEAKYMEPEQRLFLQAAWEAIEDGGYGGSIRGSQTAVFAGHDRVAGTVYRNFTGGLQNDNTLALTGTYPSILPSRISYLLDLKGPSLVIDTACSSGLVAVHSACQALKNKECDMAIAGGISLQLWPVKYGSFMMVETNDDTVRTFDRRASGTLWGEGVCVFLLKPLSRAKADGDAIHAVIKGSAVNNDGSSSGITAPNAEAQEEVIVRAWQNAKIDAESLAYIESHGTGTVMGDPIEIKALRNAFGRFTSRKQFCAIGSLKPNIGHLVSASGTASLLKVVMTLKHSQLPPTINFEEPNNYISFYDSPVFINDKLRPWNPAVEGEPMQAGISSFGFSGTNCHMVVGKYSPSDSEINVTKQGAGHVFTLSGRSQTVLQKLINNYISFFNKYPAANLKQVCYTASAGRGHYEHRLAILADSVAELKAKLISLEEEGLHSFSEKDNVFYGRYKIAMGITSETEPGVMNEAQKLALTRKAKAMIEDMLNYDEKEADLRATIAQFYIKGADIDWQAIYGTEPIGKLHLPVYPFETVRIWPNITPQENHDIKEKVWPLLGKVASRTEDSAVYKQMIQPDTHWVLKEHRLVGQFVLPGTALLEMAREASSLVLSTDQIEMTEITFPSLCAVQAGETREIFTEIRNEEKGCSFSISSKKGENWLVHAKGKVCLASGLALPSSESPAPEKLDEVYNVQSIQRLTPLSEFGPRWDNVRHLERSAKEMLIELELPSRYMSDYQDYGIHPALFDNALNMTIRTGNQPYVPFAFKRITFNRQASGRLRSWIKAKDQLYGSGETSVYDIVITDETGRVVVLAEGYMIRKVHPKDMMKREEMFHRASWVAMPEEQGQISPIPVTVAMIHNGCEMGKQIAKCLSEQGITVIQGQFASSTFLRNNHHYEIDGTEQSFDVLLEATRDRGLSHVLFLADNVMSEEGLFVPGGEEVALNKGALALYRLTRSIVSRKFGKPVSLILAATNAAVVTGKEQTVNPLGASLFSLGRVIGQEYSSIKVRCIDLEKGFITDKLPFEFLAENTHFKVAYREGLKYTEKLEPIDLSGLPATNLKVRDKGVYVITGGTGAIGLAFARWLSAKERVNICLMNRTPFPDRKDWDHLIEGNEKLRKQLQAIRSIEESGSEVILSCTDVTDKAELETSLHALRERFGRINGVIHSAGIPGGGFIIRRDEESFRKVVQVKMDGTAFLDQLTRSDQLDFFLSFSSIIAYLGGPGQGDYACANGFLEAFAEARTLAGHRTLTIAWPPWTDEGMAADQNYNEQNAIFRALSANVGVEAFERIFSKDVTRVIIGELDQAKAFAMQQHLNMMPGALTAAPLTCEGSGAQGGQDAEKMKETGVALKGRNGSVYDKYERRVANLWGKVLDVHEIDIHDSFMQLGGDSIAAANLLREMEAEYGNIVDIIDIFTYPTVGMIAEYICHKLEGNRSDNVAMTLEEIMRRLAAGEITVKEAAELRNKLKTG